MLVHMMCLYIRKTTLAPVQHLRNEGTDVVGPLRTPGSAFLRCCAQVIGANAFAIVISPEQGHVLHRCTGVVVALFGAIVGLLCATLICSALTAANLVYFALA